MFEAQGDDCGNISKLELRKLEKKRYLQHAKYSYHLQQFIISKSIHFSNILLVVYINSSNYTVSTLLIVASCYIYITSSIIVL